MRRSEREMTDPSWIRQTLADAPALVLAMNTDAAPYMVAVNHVLVGDDIFFHCAQEGHKLDLLRSDPRVGFFAVVDIHTEGTTTRYRSVLGTGVAETVTDPAIRNTVLKALAKHYHAPCQFPVSEKKLAQTRIVRIRVESLTGKFSRSGEGPRPVPHYER